ncbi:MAG: ATP-binding cassette domain-containing protein, partial [Candidatus Absconditabacterales bacterium]
MNSEHKVITYKLPLEMKKHDRIMFTGPNGIGKSTLLKRLMMIHQHKENIMKEYRTKIEDKENPDIFIKEPDTTHPEEKMAMIHNNVKVGYYSQDFDSLAMDMNVRDNLQEIARDTSDQDIYRVAAQFLLTKELLKNTIGSLSEGQKGLLCYARFVLQKPHLLILDEPTNHINFRHIPVIAQSLNTYEGAMIIVSHDKGFTDQLEHIQVIDLGKLVK